MGISRSQGGSFHPKAHQWQLVGFAQRPFSFSMSSFIAEPQCEQVGIFHHES